MVEVRIDRNNLVLALKGHARYSPGNDVVCAGCSALVCALAAYVEDKRCGEAQLRSGDSVVECGPEAREAFELVRLGLLEIARAHPQCVKVRECISVIADVKLMDRKERELFARLAESGQIVRV